MTRFICPGIPADIGCPACPHHGEHDEKFTREGASCCQKTCGWNGKKCEEVMA